MKADPSLISVGSFNLRYSHLLIIGVLALSFTISMLIRSQPAEFGFELNEFDPFYNYRATQYMVENGIVQYYEWHDDLSWHPTGRDISDTSQVMLHLTAAATYQVFGGGSSLYDFTIVFPAVIGSLTAVVFVCPDQGHGRNDCRALCCHTLLCVTTHNRQGPPRMVQV